MSVPESSPSPSPSGLLSGYAGGLASYDEMAVAGEMRPHWRAFMESLQRLGQHELASRWENGRRLISEHGVTYNVYGDPQGMDRPWGLDFVPLLITAEEWSRIEAGLIQRSRLFNLILADIYGGSQRLLRDGFLPPELVYANPGFLRPCRGIRIPAEVYLHLHACDLGRATDGQWWVLSDRTQAPSGSGYALENRTVVSRVLPEEIRDCNVQRLSGFFRQQREMLFNLAPPGRSHPSIVLLTPGPHNETYFEHAYLARHLGFPLIEGADLTVRDRRVFLKTIEGLQPVDVILRRVDDSFCDPLELRGDSFLGVSGLIEATRAGNVTVANALGVGLMESPAFLAFLPTLCRHLLGEELLMPSIATWWCGQAEEMRYVTEHLDTLTVKPAFGARRSQPPAASGDLRSRRKVAEDRAKLIEAIQAAPRDFVAQERVKLSRAPAWLDDHLTARSVVLRAYVANGGGSSSVLPGGLTRVSKNPNDLVVSMQSGGGSKDTWVLANGSANRSEPAQILSGTHGTLTQASADAPVGESSADASSARIGVSPEHADEASALQPPKGSTEIRLADQVTPGVPSRAADHLFWLGRYTERLEQLLRVLRCVLGRVSGETGGEGSIEWQGLAELTANLGLFPHAPRFGATSPPHPGDHPGSSELSQRMLHLLYQPDEPGGVRELLKRVRFIASTVRDRFSGDTWRILGRLEVDARARPGRLPLARATTLIHNLVLDLAAFNGMEMENMTRGHGWRFLDFGRRLERGLSVLKLLRSAASVEAQRSGSATLRQEMSGSGTLRQEMSAFAPLRRDLSAVLEPVLEIADSVMTYRRRYFTAPRLAGVLDLLLRDESNPRSLIFQVNLLRDHADALAADSKTNTAHLDHARIQSLATALRSFAPDDGMAQPAEGARLLPDLLSTWATDLAGVSDQVTNRYFSHSVSRIS